MILRRKNRASLRYQRFYSQKAIGVSAQRQLSCISRCWIYLRCLRRTASQMSVVPLFIAVSGRHRSCCAAATIRQGVCIGNWRLPGWFSERSRGWARRIAFIHSAPFLELERPARRNRKMSFAGIYNVAFRRA